MILYTLEEEFIEYNKKTNGCVKMNFIIAHPFLILGLLYRDKLLQTRIIY